MPQRFLTPRCVSTSRWCRWLRAPILACRDGRLDLKELMRVLYKVDLDVDMASARDAAVDAFILFYVDGARCARGTDSLGFAFLGESGDSWAP